MPLRMKQKVYITSRPKIDGRVNEGIIVGIELIQDKWCLGYYSKNDYYSNFKVYRYKVAYQDCFTNNFNTEWYFEDDISTKKQPS